LDGRHGAGRQRAAGGQEGAGADPRGARARGEGAVPRPAAGGAMSIEPELLLDDLVFPEGPRWHDGRLWFSDMHAHEVVAVDEHGKRETIVEVPGSPSGLGWLP